MFTLSDFDYVNEVLCFFHHKNIPPKELFPELDEKVNRRSVIKFIIGCFWEVICEKLVDDYVLTFPMGTIKLGLGYVNRLPKNFKFNMHTPMHGQYCKMRMIIDKSLRYVMYKVTMNEMYEKQYKSLIINGKIYRTFEV